MSRTASAHGIAPDGLAFATAFIAGLTACAKAPDMAAFPGFTALSQSA